MKRKLALILAVVMIISILTACGNNDVVTPPPVSDTTTSTTTTETTTETEEPPPAPPEGSQTLINYANTGSLPISDTGVTLSLVTHSGHAASMAPASNDLPVYQLYEEMTGIHIEWDIIPVDTYEEVLNIRLASLVDLPDLIIGYGGATLDRMANDGIIIEQTELLRTYGYYSQRLPNFDAIFATMFAADGKFYGLSSTVIDSHLGLNFMVSNFDLEAVGRSMPTTPDEFTDMLRAFRDELGMSAPLALYSSGFPNFDALRFMGFWFGGEYVYNYWSTVYDGKAVMIWEHPAFKKSLELLNLWYSEGLMNKDYASADLNKLYEYVTNGDSGVTFFWATWTYMWGAMSPHGADIVAQGLDPENDLAMWSVLPPLKTADGDRVLSRRLSLAGDAMLISTGCDPEKHGYAMAWYDFLFANPTVELVRHNGVPGIHHVEGTLEKIDPPAGFDSWASWVTADGGFQPPYAHRQSLDGWRSWMPQWLEDESWALQQFYRDPPMIELPFSEAEVREFDIEMASLETYVAAWVDNFITGAAPLDKWDEFISGLNAFPIDGIRANYQARLERQWAAAD